MVSSDDIASLIIHYASKILKNRDGIKLLSYEVLGGKFGEESKYSSGKKHTILFKIKHTVNKEELRATVKEAISISLVDPLDLEYIDNYKVGRIRGDISISSLKLLNKSKSSVGVRGNINYIELDVYIRQSEGNSFYPFDDSDYEYDIVEKIKE